MCIAYTLILAQLGNRLLSIGIASPVVQYQTFRIQNQLCEWRIVIVVVARCFVGYRSFTLNTLFSLKYAWIIRKSAYVQNLNSSIHIGQKKHDEWKRERAKKSTHTQKPSDEISCVLLIWCVGYISPLAFSRLFSLHCLTTFYVRLYQYSLTFTTHTTRTCVFYVNIRILCDTWYFQWIHHTNTSIPMIINDYLMFTFHSEIFSFISFYFDNLFVSVSTAFSVYEYRKINKTNTNTITTITTHTHGPASWECVRYTFYTVVSMMDENSMPPSITSTTGFGDCNTSSVSSSTEQFIICCKVCGSLNGLRRCSRCKSVYYCSQVHQQVDWRVHKIECKKFATNLATSE